MEEPQYIKKEEYSSRQRIGAEIFYILIVLACLVCLAGVIWSIADFISPTGKLQVFLDLSLGFQIAIVAGFLAGLFFLLIFFFGLFRKGLNSLLKIMFKKKEVEERFKNRLTVKIVAGGLLISVIAIIIGLVISVIYEIFIGPEGGSPFATFLSELSTGNWILLAGIALFATAGIGLFMVYFWKNGYYVILKLMGSLESKE